MFKYELGLKAKDKITGLTGIIVARVEHLFGCNTYGLASQVLQEGKRQETEWLDEGRLEIKGKGIRAKDVTSTKPGGLFSEHPSLK